MKGKDNIGSSESFVYSTQDTKESKIEGGRFNQKRHSNKIESSNKDVKNEFDSSISQKMKRTNGFIKFTSSKEDNFTNNMLHLKNEDLKFNRQDMNFEENNQKK